MKTPHRTSFFEVIKATAAVTDLNYKKHIPRCSLPKKKQREMGLLPALPGKDVKL